MRRAISCVYCPPKSSTTTPPSSAFILPPCSCTGSAARFAALSIMPSLTSRRDLPACLAQRSVCHSDAPSHSLPQLHALQDPPRGDPPARETSPALGHSLGQPLPPRCPLPASDHDRATSPAKGPRCAPASPTVPPPGAGPSEPASVSQSQGFPSSRPGGCSLPAAPEHTFR